VSTLSERIAAYAAALRFEDLPPEVVHCAKRMVVDTVGCALGGYRSVPTDIARRMAARIDSKRPASIFCSGETTSLEMAGFVNDVMARYLDFNDGYTSKEAGHPSDSIPALMAAAEVSGAHGRELIVAIVLAYELFCRFCDAVEIKLIGFDHATLGAIASVVGASKLLGCDQKQIAEALNLTLSSSIALYQTRIQNVSLWKGCAYANANRNALFCAQLAREGMTGPSPVFEGRGGYFKAVSRTPFELEPFGGKDREFKIMQCLIKKYPLGQYSQSVAQAALEARAFVDQVDDIAQVEVRTLETAVAMMAGDPEKWRPANRETADHSMPYTAAIALLHGSIQHHHFEEAYFRDPKLLALIDRVKCVVSEEANRRAPEAMLCELELRLRDGRRHTSRVEYHRGHWRNPMSDAEVEEKYRMLAASVMPDGAAEALVRRLWRLEHEADIGQLVRLTVVR
jgi:2-methylcitrate dehydratase